MRTTIELLDAPLRSLKIQAAQSGKSLKALLHELIVQAMAMAMPVAPAAEVGLPVLSRLGQAQFEPSPMPVPAVGNADLADAQLQDDLNKLHRCGFVQ